jgi:inorganic pyrophosphatase/exopolyphosphatase
MSSIIAHNYATMGVFLPKNIAGLLLSAILSDTLNLRSPTTTAWDERIVSMLVQYVGVKDVNELAAKQFRAKSHALSLMTPYALVNGDMKQFKFTNDAVGKTYTVAYSVVETTDAAASLARTAEILPEMRAVKANAPSDAPIDACFLAVVDIVNLDSTLLVCGRVEGSLAVEAYGGSLEDDGSVLQMPGLVSRKKDFVPALTKAVREGWTPPADVVSDHEKNDTLKRSRSMVEVAQGDVVVDYSEQPSGKLVRRDSANYTAADEKAGQGA